MWNTWRCAVADLPLGGSMGGVICDPHDLSPLEQERLCRGWVRQVARNVGPDWDVPSPDLMTTAQHMLWMLDEYETIHGRRSPGFTASRWPGGSAGRKAPRAGTCISSNQPPRLPLSGFGNAPTPSACRKMGGAVTCVQAGTSKHTPRLP
jgi:glutamate dehydrogenase/leucine dehydrogenase